MARIFLAQGISEITRPPGFVLDAEEAEMDIGWAALPDVVEAIFLGQVKNPTLVMGVLALHATICDGRLDGLRPA
jgi:ADP-ribose pyrophosphatase